MAGRSGVMGVSVGYKVLRSDLLRQTERDRAMSIGSFVRTGEEAMALAGHDGFGYKVLDHYGRVGALIYKGIEIALLFRREVQEVQPMPSDPVPERTLTGPSDEWVRVDLLELADRTRRNILGHKLEQTEKEVENLKVLLRTSERELREAKDQVSEMRPEMGQLSQFRMKVKTMEGEAKLAASDYENLNQKFRDQVRKETERRQRDARAWHETLNTLWMASQDKAGDTLYRITLSQAREAMGKLGIVLVEPQVGQEFDPHEQEAVHAYPFAKGSREVGTVQKVQSVGLKLDGKLLIPARVGVGVEV